MLYATEPVRDRAWWVRTGVYLLILMSHNPGNSMTWPVSQWQLTVLSVLTMVVGGLLVFWRDRHPIWLAVFGLVAGATLAENAVAMGAVAVAGRARVPATLGYAILASAILAAPFAPLMRSALNTTYTGPGIEVVLWGFQTTALVVLPTLVGVIRRKNREAGWQRAEFEARQRALAAQEAAAAERNRIAQEMHDVLGHKLSLITMQAGALGLNAADGGRVAEQAEMIRTTARQALDELRGIIGVLGQGEGDVLHPQPGLAEALELVDRHREAGSRIAVSNRLGVAKLPAATGAALHRIVREGLTNAHRHAPGAAVRLTLTGAPGDGLRVELVNRPSTRTGEGPGNGRGLPGLTERVRALGGRLSAEATAEGGFRLAAELPWPVEGGSGE